MKRKHFLTGAAFIAAAIFPVAAWSQFGGAAGNFVSIGSANLTPGQYWMSNLATGQSLFVVIGPQGQMQAQDPRSVQVMLQPGQSGLIPGMTPGATGVPGATGGGGFGGLLKQGLEGLMQNRLPGE